MVDRERRLTAEPDDEASDARQPAAPQAPKASAKPQVRAKRKKARHAGARKPRQHDTMRDDAPDDLLPEERGIEEALQTLTDEERAALFFGSSLQSALPDLPQIPGFHTCWLTSTHQSDTIAKRQRLGYQLIHADELGDEWRSYSINGGEFAGCITCNEMVAAKLPKRIFNYLMQQAHHYSPLSEEEKIRAKIDAHKEELEERGSYLQEGDAMPSLVKRAPAPQFVR